jgi:hypothetical protein
VSDEIKNYLTEFKHRTSISPTIPHDELIYLSEQYQRKNSTILYDLHEHGEVGFYLAQPLMGHRIGRNELLVLRRGGGLRV